MRHHRLYSLLKARQRAETNGLIAMTIHDWKYWLVLPPYADIYIRPLYELITDQEGLIEFVHHFLIDYSETTLEGKKICIEAVIFPLYKDLTGRNYPTNYLTAYNIESWEN